MPVTTIPVEEACLPRELLPDWERALGKQFFPAVRDLLTDIDGKRLEEMDEFGIEMAVLSLTVPGPQGEPDPVVAADMARRGNDALASRIAQHPARFAGLGTVSMHDTDTACAELERAVRELGLSGVLVNGSQTITADFEQRFYDDRRYEDFWATAEELGVPVYLHPALIRPGSARARDLAGFDWLRDAAWAWGSATGLHALRIITSGVFDRHPRAQLVIGHNGEHIVSDLWRIDNRIRRQPVGCPAARPVSSYFATNVHITTSGEFGDNGLRHIIAEVGADRVLFAVDYPYEDNGEGTHWFASAPVSDIERSAIGRENAISLFRLPLQQSARPTEPAGRDAS